MMTNEKIIQKVINETDVNLLENCTIEDIEGIVNTIMAEALLEIGDLEDDT